MYVTADSSVKPNLEVEIDGECYSMDKIPSANSGVVKAKIKKLLCGVNSINLISDLSRVGCLIRITYNAARAACYQFTNEQIEIQQLGHDIIKLCNKSAQIVAKFEEDSSNILTDLQCTYGYLLDNLEEMAIDTLFSVSKLAGEMEQAALELHHDFVAEEKKVAAMLEHTQHAKKIQFSKVEEEKRRRIELGKAMKHEEELINKHQEKEWEPEDRQLLFSRIKIFDKDDSENPARLRQNRLDALEAEKTTREKQQEALANMSTFTTKLRQCAYHQEMAECALDALHDAIGALKYLSTVMMPTALFWKQMQDHCRSLAESEMQSQVETAMQKYSEEKRLKVWTSSAFKRKAIQLYSGWVAFNSVCRVYMEQIKETQRDLYKCITENPTYEESKRALPELVERFMADLKSEQKAIEEKDFKAQKEMHALSQAEGQ